MGGITRALSVDACVPDRIRTCGPLIKSQLLYQLSYGDNGTIGSTKLRCRTACWEATIL